MKVEVVSALKDKISLFVPELPGYGISSLPPKADKRTVGKLILEALQEVFGKERPVIWCGHDRGARVGHRIMVDNDPAHNVEAGILMDIVPTLEQWRAFSNPVASAAYYHWPFLATDLAPAMIETMGGRYWCDANLNRTKGGNEAGLAKLKENQAWDHYCTQFSNPECIAGSCADYKSGAMDEPKEQESDQKEGKKVKMPICVLYSATNLGRMHDVPEIWKQWADGELETHGILYVQKVSRARG
ncbi:hypothetical protein LTR37_014137 [Vermiconidia calcicola]|uniref:Uncharacterized protein n=1 Tax=Vermiconidia calcicola TaxID=1690605 RepID=A0ACC3MV73_9PEZI|nr:hypothetical protein LTR37_014137 [Vermiconidia calcicola]